MKCFFLIAAFLLFSFSVSAQAEFDWGSQRPDARNREWRIYLGNVSSLSGNVNETFRAFYAATGQDSKQSLAESYDLNDFGIDCPYFSWGLQCEQKHKYWGYKWDLSILNLSANAKASRDYYIGVGEDIVYQDVAYDHLKITAGSEFDIDLLIGMTDIMFSFTPFTFFYGGGDNVKLTPSLDLGLVLFGGKLDIDAGATVGITTYQNPPIDFAVGGEASTSFIAGAPKIGLGADLRIGPDDGFQFVLHGDVGFFAYDGSTKPFTGNSHREKNIDATYLACTGEAGVAIPFNNGTALTAGLRLQVISLEGSIESKEKDPDKIIAARERFDKEVDFSMTSLMFFIGYNY